MYKILTLNKISEKGLNTLTENYTHSDSEQNPDGILLRSFKMHDMELPKSLLAVARCGAGVNNIPLDKCTEQGVVVFNTPGANANAVKELVLTALLISSRKIIDGYNWTQTLTDDAAAKVEKGKSQFGGPELYGKKLGVIGLGAIGVLVANAAETLGMEVMGYDPYLSVKSAWLVDKDVKRASLDELIRESDYITIHVPYLPSTKGMLGEEEFAKVKKGVRVLNLARGELVDNKAIKAALADGRVGCYVTDFPNEEVIGVENVITLPHLGASTPEAEDNCAVMAAEEMMDYLENGNIVNSVNFPRVNIDPSDDDLPRVGVFTHNAKIEAITNAVGEFAHIISSKYKTQGEFGYALFVVDGDANKAAENTAKVNGVIRTRVAGIK